MFASNSTHHLIQFGIAVCALYGLPGHAYVHTNHECAWCRVFQTRVSLYVCSKVAMGYACSALNVHVDMGYGAADWCPSQLHGEHARCICSLRQHAVHVGALQPPVHGFGKERFVECSTLQKEIGSCLHGHPWRRAFAPRVCVCLFVWVCACGYGVLLLLRWQHMLEILKQF
jgi:hypothetical protein